jgi:RNA polymerase sigma factor (sigma-70 family)
VKKSNKQQSKDEEVKKYLYLIEREAKKYKNFGVPFEDLVNEGVFGIYKAKKNFDPKHGVKFSSYAIWWIRQCILSALSEQKLVHFPVGKINLNRKIRDVQEQYTRAYGRKATDEEIQAASLQFVRKLSGFNKPSKINEEAFMHAIDEISVITKHLLSSMTTNAPHHNREIEAQLAKERSAKRFGTDDH